MTIDQQRHGDTVVIAPAGRIDSTTSDRLDAHLTPLSSSGTPAIVVDFAGVEYISSAGLRVMLTLAKRIRERRGRLALCALNDGVRQVFELAGFLSLFTVASSRDDALQALTVR
jgi:anti-anti-sigma factor